MALVVGTNCGFVTVAPSADPLGDAPTAIDNYAYAVKHTSPAGAIKVTEIGWWCNEATQEANFEVGIYDSDGSPNNLVAGEARTNAKGTGAGWKKATGLNITISGSTVYWIGVQLDDTATPTPSDYELNASYPSEYKSGATTLPDPWDGGSPGSVFLAFYAVYTTGALEVNVSDSISIAESETVAPSLVTINISDSITIAEDQTSLIPILILNFPALHKRIEIV